MTPKPVSFRPATAEDYRRFKADATETYVRQMLDFLSMDEAQARANAATDLDRLLPEDGPLPEHRITIALVGGQQVGTLWIGPRGDGSGLPWVYDVQVDPAAQRLGYGRALMVEAERQVQESGGTRIALSVFGTNHAAIALYESLGYEVDVQQMSKRLPS